MNLIREIKQYQAPDGTCFNTKEKAEEKKEKIRRVQSIRIIGKKCILSKRG